MRTELFTRITIVIASSLTLVYRQKINEIF